MTLTMQPPPTSTSPINPVSYEKTDDTDSSKILRACSTLRKIHLSKIVPGWKSSPNPNILPDPMINPIRNKNPYIDSSFTNVQTITSANTDSERDTQRRIDAILAHDDNLQERRLKYLVNSEVLNNLKKLGVCLTGDVSRGYFITGENTGKVLHIPPAHIRYAMTFFRQFSNDYFDFRAVDLDRISTIGEALHRANRKFSLSVSLNEILDLYFILGGDPAEVTQHFDPSIRDVINDIAEQLYVPLRDTTQVKNPKILLYTTFGGGGHLVQTQAIEKYLHELGIATTIMGDDANVFDALSYLTNGAASQSDPYNRVLQRKMGMDGRIITNDIDMRNEFKKYDYLVDVLYVLSGSKNHFQILRETLADPNYVAMIDSNPHQTGMEGAAISNGLRYIRWPTDLDTWFPLLRSFDAMDAKQGKVAVTSSDPIANRELSPSHRHPGDMWKKEILTQDANISVNPNILKDPRIIVAGYPIRSDIKKLPSLERDNHRSNLGISPSDHVILVMMGSQGKRDLFDIVQQLIDCPPSNIKEKIAVFCIVGANFDIKQNIKNITSCSTLTHNMEVHMADEVLGTPNEKLTAKQMNILYNIADLMISKPGGSVSAEALETETPLLMCALNRGEEGNASYLIRSGLGIMRDHTMSFSQHIESFLCDPKKYYLNPAFKLPSWKDCMPSILEDFIGLRIQKVSTSTKQLGTV